MEIKRSSLHYKFSNFGAPEKYNDNLCKYCNRIIFNIFLLIFICFTIFIVSYSYFTDPQVISTTIMILFVICSIVLPILTIYFIREKNGGPILAIGKGTLKDNIFIEYLKAKKRKICPLIKYID